MLVAVIADTHLRRPGALPEACVRRLIESELIIHAGDVISEEAFAELVAIGPPVRAVAGNVDVPALAARLPARLELELDGSRCGLIHDAGAAHGRHARLRKDFPGCDAVVFGHSHIPLHEHDDGFEIFNPGSPTARRRQPRHTMGMLRASRGSLAFELVTLD
jgi:putative phosphoesterase